MPRKPFSRWLAALASVLLIGTAFAATERFEYDPLGRLTRMVDSGNKVTDYQYDAAGNLEEVRVGGVLTPPVVDQINPTYLRRGETKSFIITGTGLLGTTVTASDPGLDISGVQVSATQIGFSLFASLDTPVASHSINVASARGNAIVSLDVAPALPKVHVDPAPLAVPPDNVSRLFTVRLSHIDAVDHTFALSASNSNVAVSPATLTIPAGQLSVAANIRGVTAGQSTITLASPTLGNTLVPVFITAEFVGITTSIAPILGLVLEGVEQPGQSQSVPMTSPAIGVVVGDVINGLTPGRVHVGSGPTDLVISGTGLAGVQSVTIEPSAGLTIGAATANADGTSISLPVTVAADATVGQRRVVVKNAAGAVVAPVTPISDRFLIARPEPEITSVDPLFGTPDTTVKLTIRGTNLHEASAISLSPSNGIEVDANPVVSSDGTTITASVTLAINAAIGDYLVTADTPSGTSSASADSTNTFKVVNELTGSVTPIVAPVVGVVLEDTSTPASSPISLTSTPVGLALGPVAIKLDPAVGIVGQEMTLTIHGSELASATSVSLVPDTGLTVGEVTAAIDGKTITVPINVAADAPRVPRTVKIFAGTAQVPFASADAGQFDVSLPQPEIQSVTPIVLQIGQAPTAVVVRGRNLQNASQVTVSPSAGMTISTPPVVSADGTEATVNVSAAAGSAVGQRLVTVTTPAGQSSNTLVPANGLNLVDSAGSLFGPIAAPLIGIVVESEDLPASTSIGPVVAVNVGILVEEESLPVSTTTSEFARSVGVAVGPIALSLNRTGFAPGYIGELLVQGLDLGAVTAATVYPADGISLGSPSPTADGQQLSIPVSVDTDAARGPRALRLETGTGDIPFANAHVGQLTVGPGTPQFDSITPILAEQGDVVTMTIRGSNFHDALAVTATPDSGFTFIPGTLTVNASGTELTAKFVLSADAAVGSRVIQVLVPGASSEANPTSANTFTVFSQ